MEPATWRSPGGFGPLGASGLTVPVPLAKLPVAAAAGPCRQALPHGQPSDASTAEISLSWDACGSHSLTYWVGAWVRGREKVEIQVQSLLCIHPLLRNVTLHSSTPETLGNVCAQFKFPSFLSHFILIYHEF